VTIGEREPCSTHEFNRLGSYVSIRNLTVDVDLANAATDFLINNRSLVMRPKTFFKTWSK